VRRRAGTCLPPPARAANSLTLAQHPPPRPPGPPAIPGRPPASRRPGQVETCYAAPDDATGASGLIRFAVARLSSLLELIIIVFLGVVIGNVSFAMYLPICKLGAVV
jgi:hypothetical protein